MYLSTADGGRAITDAVIETYQVVNIGRALAGEPPLAPKDGARFHFALPGSVQGFAGRPSVGHRRQRRRAESERHAQRWPCAGTTSGRTRPVVATTPTFIPPEAIVMPGYTLLASPTLYPGQEVRARLVAHRGNAGPVEARLLIRFYGERR